MLCVFKNIGSIRVDESACFGIIVTAIEIIESGFYVIVVRTVTDRVKVTYVIGSIIIDRKYLTPCIVCVTCHLKTRRGVDLGNVTLKILTEVVVGSVVFKANDSATAVVVGERLGSHKLYHFYRQLSRKNQTAISNGLEKHFFEQC